MSSSEKEKLLQGVLEDANYAAFKAEMAELSRAELRRAHRKVLPFWLPLAAGLTMLGAIVSQFWPHPIPAPQTTALDTVASRPLGISEVVHSALNVNDLVQTSARTLEVVETSPSESVPPISDGDLLALMSSNSPSGGFVQVGSQKRVVLFF